MFIKALNEVIENKEEIVENIERVVKLIDTSKLETEMTKLEEKLVVMVNKINQNVYTNAKRIEDSNIDLSEYEELKNKIDDLQSKISKSKERKSKLEIYIRNLKQTDIVKEFSMEYWGMFLDKMIIYKNKIVCEFVGGNIVTL